LEAVVRNTRSRVKGLDIEKRDYKKKEKNTDVEKQAISDDIAGTINWLNNTTAHDEDKRNQILQKMRSIREYRMNWITTISPSLTEILNKFKRYIDCEILVSKKIFISSIL
jgi:hypothetical protein